MSFKSFLKTTAFFLVVSLLFPSSESQALSLFKLKTKVVDETTQENRCCSYLLLSYSSTVKRKRPLWVIFSGTGQDYRQYFQLWESEAVKHGAMVLVIEWETPERHLRRDYQGMKKLIDKILLQYQGDKKKVFVSGISAGGMIAKELLSEFSGFWRGAVLMAVTPHADWVKEAQDKKWPPLVYALGKKDESNLVSELLETAGLHRKAGHDVHLILDPEAGHEHPERWTPVIFRWMEEQLKGASEKRLTRK